jgi:hypothetical protein
VVRFLHAILRLIGEERQRQLYASALLLFPIYLEREFCLQYRAIFIADFDFHTAAEAVEAPASYRILCHINQRARRLFLNSFNIGQFKPSSSTETASPSRKSK